MADNNTLLDKIEYLTLSLESFSKKSILLEERVEELTKRIDQQDKIILDLSSKLINYQKDEKTSTSTIVNSPSNGNLSSYNTASSKIGTASSSSTLTETTETGTIPASKTATISTVSQSTPPVISSANSTPTLTSSSSISNTSSPNIISLSSNTPSVPTPPPLPPVTKSSGSSLWNRARVGIGAARAFSTNNLFQKTDAEGNVSPIIGGLTKEDLFYIPPTSPKPPTKSLDLIKNTVISTSNENLLDSSSPKTPRATTSGSANVLSPLPAGCKWAVVWEYNAHEDEWTRGVIAVEIESKPFAKGALRNAYKLWIRSNPVDQYSQFAKPEHQKYEEGKTMNTSKLPSLFGPVDSMYVAKDALLKSQGTFDRYFDDVKMQMICREYGIRYNSNSPPKPIEFLSAWVIEVQSSDGNYLFGLELFMKGEFKKQNSNYGSVFSDRNTPQTFSHFTYECSNHDLLIVDIQGVDDFYTDPQIHTKDGKGFGAGNLGSKGIERFLTSHKCNPICIQYGLPPIGVTLNDSKQASRVIRGTMLLPDLIPDLDPLELPPLPIPKNPEASELQNQTSLLGHESRVCKLIYKCGRLFSSDEAGHVKVWDTNSLTLIESFRAHRKSVDCMCLSSKYLFTAGSDKTIRVWEFLTDLNVAPQEGVKTPVVSSSDCKYKLEDHSGEINGLCFDETSALLYSASFDKSIKVWDTKTMKCIKTLNAHSKSVKSIFLSGKYLFSGSNDASIKVWDRELHMCIYGMSDAHEAWITSLLVFNGKLFSGSRDGQVKEWNLSTFMSTNQIDQNNDNITSFIPVNGHLLIGSDDSTIKILDFSNMKIIYSIKAHRSGVGSLETDGQKIFSGGSDSVIKVWNWVDKN